MVARSGVNLGVLDGPGSVGREFDQALMKYHSRCAHVRSVPGLVAERHQTFVVSVSPCLAQVAELPARASRGCCFSWTIGGADVGRHRHCTCCA